MSPRADDHLDIVARLRGAAELLLAHRFQGLVLRRLDRLRGAPRSLGRAGDARYAAFARGFVRGWATRAGPYREMDNTAPGLVMTRLAAGDPHVLDAARELAAHLRTRPVVDGVFASFSGGAVAGTVRRVRVERR